MTDSARYRSVRTDCWLATGYNVGAMTKFGWAAYATLVVAFLGFVVLDEIQHQTIRKAADNAAWDYRLADYLQSANLVTPTVGVIQFIKQGRYSIEIEDLKYTANGLELSGYIGNATPIALSTLTVIFTASKPYYKNRERFLKGRGTSESWFTIGWPDDEIGQGQVLLPYLGAGFRMPFSVVIPNVKQTPDSVEIGVSFSGERYSYVR